MEHTPFDNDFVEQEEPSGAVRDMSEEEKAEITSGYEQIIPTKSQKSVEKKEQERPVEFGVVMDLVAKNFKAKTGREPDSEYLNEMRQIYGQKSQSELTTIAGRLSRELEVLDLKNRRN